MADIHDNNELSRLSPELLHHVCTFLDQQDLRSLSLTSKELRIYALKPLYKTTIRLYPQKSRFRTISTRMLHHKNEGTKHIQSIEFEEHAGSEPPHVRSFHQIGTVLVMLHDQLQSLRIMCTRNNTRLMHWIGMYQRHLKSLVIQARSSIGWRHLSPLSDLQQLTRLRLPRVESPGTTCAKVLGRLSQLRELELEDSEVLHQFTGAQGLFNKLKSLTIDCILDGFCFSPNVDFSSLKFLKLGSVDTMIWSDVDALDGFTVPNLEAFHYFGFLSDPDVLSRFLFSFSSLQRLYIYATCSGEGSEDKVLFPILDGIMKHKGLRELCISYCPANFPEPGWTLEQAGPYLTKITAICSNAAKLQQLALPLPRLFLVHAERDEYWDDLEPFFTELAHLPDLKAFHILNSFYKHSQTLPETLPSDIFCLLAANSHSSSPRSLPVIVLGVCVRQRAIKQGYPRFPAQAYLAPDVDSGLVMRSLPAEDLRRRIGEFEVVEYCLDNDRRELVKKAALAELDDE